MTKRITNCYDKVIYNIALPLWKFSDFSQDKLLAWWYHVHILVKIPPISTQYELVYKGKSYAQMKRNMIICSVLLISCYRRDMQAEMVPFKYAKRKKQIRWWLCVVNKGNNHFWICKEETRDIQCLLPNEYLPVLTCVNVHYMSFKSINDIIYRDDLVLVLGVVLFSDEYIKHITTFQQ